MCDLNNPEIQKMMKELRQSITNDIGISNIFEGVKVKLPLSYWINKKSQTDSLRKGMRLFFKYGFDPKYKNTTQQSE